MRIAIAAVALISIVMGTPGRAHAVCDAPPDLDTALRTAPVAFIGEVNQTNISTGETEMTVLWVWKGENLPPQVDLVPPESSTDSGVAFTPGVTYLVIPENNASPFKVGECGGTRRYRADGEVIPPDLQTATGRSVPLPPGVSAAEAASGAAEESGGFPIGLLTMGLLVLAVAAFVIFRKRSQRDPDAPRKRRFRQLAGSSWRGRSGSTHVRRLRRRSRR